MRAKRIGPHRTNLIVRCTKCKNFCAADHANVSDIRRISRCGARETAAEPGSLAPICRFFRSGGGPGLRRLQQSPAPKIANNGDVLRVIALRAASRPCRPLSSARICGPAYSRSMRCASNGDVGSCRMAGEKGARLWAFHT
jgi:hypothetical protein